ncbi:putative membrane protein YkvI [Herbaspirillum sp. Sphag1AN]|uniref:hypothetical protein n=1 Tax=unclassified Herbaspirillum TaxID=2624150 RepID=UPI001608CB83|nr:MULTISPECIES: hypothetical protein [unclassified Herbaspirillum]MBB3211467.1 putative membrane protein YkvI [Herbaspirillum sp. Sphag1AN]
MIYPQALVIGGIRKTATRRQSRAHGSDIESLWFKRVGWFFIIVGNVWYIGFKLPLVDAQSIYRALLRSLRGRAVCSSGKLFSSFPIAVRIFIAASRLLNRIGTVDTLATFSLRWPIVSP